MGRGEYGKKRDFCLVGILRVFVLLCLAFLFLLWMFFSFCLDGGGCYCCWEGWVYWEKVYFVVSLVDEPYSRRDSCFFILLFRFFFHIMPCGFASLILCTLILESKDDFKSNIHLIGMIILIICTRDVFLIWVYEQSPRLAQR